MRLGAAPTTGYTATSEIAAYAPARPRRRYYVCADGGCEITGTRPPRVNYSLLRYRCRAHKAPFIATPR